MSTAFNDQLATLRDKVESVKFGMFTTTNPDLSLSSRPMTSQQIDTQGQLWFFTSDVSVFVKIWRRSH